jgi:hypothetical protein
LRDLVGNVSGIFGQSQVGAGDYLIDYARRRLLFDAPGALVSQFGGIAVPLEWSEGRPAIVVSILGASGPAIRVRLVLDSGIDRLTLFGGAARQLAAASPKTSTVLLEGALGTTTAASARALLQTGGRDRKVHITLLADERGRHEDGLLPTSFFGSVLVSAAGGIVKLDATPNDKTSTPAKALRECS